MLATVEKGVKLLRPVLPRKNCDVDKIPASKSNPPKKGSKQYQLFERDGWKCLRCGSDYDLTRDHIISRKAGGSSAMKNLQTLCGRCNVVKGDRCITYR